jgi:hypothetical protein
MASSRWGWRALAACDEGKLALGLRLDAERNGRVDDCLVLGPGCSKRMGNEPLLVSRFDPWWTSFVNFSTAVGEWKVSEIVTVKPLKFPAEGTKSEGVILVRRHTKVCV